MSLIEVIKDIQNVTCKINDINRGGCVHFAYYLSNALKRHGYDHKLVLLNIWQKVNLNLFNNEGCSHIVVYIKEIGYIDAKIIHKSYLDFYKLNYYNNNIYKYSLPKNYSLEEIRNAKFWNNTYDRRYNKFIERTINSKFKKGLKYERTS